VSVGFVLELGIPYENGGLVTLGVKGVVDATIDGIGPLCDLVAAETVVARTDDDKLGDASLVVATVVGMEEFPEEVTTFGSITV
jgi:hypothetical protein